MNLFTMADLAALLPAVILFVGAMGVMLAASVLRGRTGPPWVATLVTLLLAGVASAWQSANLSVAVSVQGMVRVDGYGLFFQGVAILAGLFAALMSEDYLTRIGVRVGEYYAVLLFGVLGMVLMGLSADLFMVFISIEIMSLAMYILCALNRNHAPSVESGFKYFILGAFSSALMLYGIAFVYGATGHTDFASITSWLASHPAPGALFAVGGVLLILGFGFKVASVPFHMWAPDVYQGAPTSVTALMSAGVKAASFAAFGRLLIGTMGEASSAWGGALALMAAATMLVGNLGALAQQDLKRMLAYSSIAHAGYVLMALSAAAHGGSGSESLSSILFYLLAYTFMNAGAFVVLCTLTKDGADTTDIGALAGLGRTNPGLAAGLSLCLLSLAGIPPTMGFVGKFYLFTATVQSGQVALALVGAVAAASGVYFYLRPMVYMYMREGSPRVSVSSASWLGLGVAMAATLVFGVFPTSALDWARASLASLLA